MIDLRIALVLAVLAVLACVPAAADTDLRMAPLNPDFVAYQATDTTMATSAGGTPVPAGLTPSPLDLSHLDEDAGGPASMAATASSYPATYDLRDQGRVTAVQDQGTAGSCWTFATLASLESYLLPGESTDYSENNMKNILSSSYSEGFDRAWDAGGDRGMSTAYLARWSGPVNEADDPYNQNSGVSPTGLTVRKHVQDVYFLADRTSATDNDEIKQFIQDYGALYIGVNWDEELYYNSATYGYYNPGYSTSGGHAIALVGWDDTYSASNFNLNPGMDGAFIAKNSWGTGWGDAGYFYISYANYPIQTITMFTGEAVTDYDNIYQYDPLGWIRSFGYSDTTAWFANIFTADGEENLDAVSFYSGQYNSPYEVYIYKNPSSGPTDGTLAASTSGTLTMPGYHTVDLPQSVSLSAGDRFSVVVKLTTPGYYYPIPVEYPEPGYSSKATASPGESYISSDGSTWEDITTSYADTNVCVKAFTTDAGQELASIVVSPATATLTVGETQTFTATGYDSGGTVITITPTWTSSNTTVGSISQSGLFTAIAAGTTTVTAESEGVSGTAAVTVTAEPVVSGSVTRSISPSSPSPGDTVTVTLTPSSTMPVSPGWGVTETLDASLVYVTGSSTADSVDQVGDNQYQFTRLGGSAFTYQVTAPATEGTYTITGTWTDGEKTTGTVGGDTAITVSDLISRYTDPSTGKVEKDGAVQAVNDYLFSGIISKEDAITVVNAYLFG